ncbi:heme A synthase, partial [Bacillus sp. B-TM1]
HSLFISCLFAVLCYLVMLGTRSKVNAKEAASTSKQTK